MPRETGGRWVSLCVCFWALTGPRRTISRRPAFKEKSRALFIYRKDTRRRPLLSRAQSEPLFVSVAELSEVIFEPVEMFAVIDVIEQEFAATLGLDFEFAA